jgi:hypothetical protein
VSAILRTIEVRSYRWPGGIGLLAPEPRAPWWLTPEGERHVFRAVVAGASLATVERFAYIHAQATGEILRAAVAATLAGEPTESRRLIAGASRLCGELLGPWVPRPGR